MDYADSLEQMLTGQIDMARFVSLLKSDAGLREYLGKLIPQDAIFDPQHPLWHKNSRIYYAENDFDLLKVLQSRHRFDNSIDDNLNIFSIISRVYRCCRPDLPYTSRYEEEADLYLEIADDYFESPEVKPVLEQIVREIVSIKPRFKRRKEIKRKVKSAFHVSGNNLPCWIQNPEWPMGKKSPMQFVNQSEAEDGVEYLFRDVDTGETRLIAQYD